jgi:hypothetical protein
VVKPGLSSEELARHFAQESQALGRLQHPGIAQIYESGAIETEFGPQPYFAWSSFAAIRSTFTRHSGASIRSSGWS